MMWPFRKKKEEKPKIRLIVTESSVRVADIQEAIEYHRPAIKKLLETFKKEVKKDGV